MHHAANLALGFALGFGLAARTGDPRWALAGFAIAAGWRCWACTTTAATRRSSSGSRARTATYRVDGGSGGRPAPPAPWPRGPREADLAGLQGLRAARRAARFDGDGSRGDPEPDAVARRMAVYRAGNGPARSCSRCGPGLQVDRRGSDGGRIQPLVPARGRCLRRVATLPYRLELPPVSPARVKGRCRRGAARHPPSDRRPSRSVRGRGPCEEDQRRRAPLTPADASRRRPRARR